MWSLSAAKTLNKCQRQWYYKNCLASWNAKAPLRRKAYLLSKLQSVSAWRGNIVDFIISKHIVSALNTRQTLMLSVAKQKAMELFDQQLKFAQSHPLSTPGLSPSKFGDKFAVLHCVEYGEGDLPEAEVERARLEINQALENLYHMDELKLELKQADYLVAQRMLSFSHMGESVRAVPDLIAFYSDRPPLIIDWKVHSFGVYKAWKQLGLYALALSRGKPHKDFPQPFQWEASEISLWEVQLLTNKIRRYRLSDKQLSELECFAAESISEMHLILGNSKKATINPTELLTASSPETCEYCNYPSICWE